MGIPLLNRVRVNVTTLGTGTMTLGSAFAANCLTMQEAGAVDGTPYPYVVVEGNDFEMGTGTPGSSGTTFTRTVRHSKIAGVHSTSAKMSLLGNAVFAIDIAAEDYATFLLTSDADNYVRADTAQTRNAAQRAQARANAGAAINQLLNVSFAISASAGALTIALKDAAGNDATAATPIALSFRNPSLIASPNVPSVLEVAAAGSVVVPSTSSCGFSSATAGRLWITGWNDGGTFRLGVFNACDGVNVFALPESGVASSLQVVAAGNSAGVHYTAGAAVTAKAFRILGYVDWTSSGVATAGTWTTTNLYSIVTFGPGIKKPGDIVQYFSKLSGATDSTGASIPFDTTIPQIGEGKQFVAQAMIPSSAANILDIDVAAQISGSAANALTIAMFNGAANAFASATGIPVGADYVSRLCTSYQGLVGSLAGVSTTFSLRFGIPSGVGYINSRSDGINLGGTYNSGFKIREIMG
jgi:hypothetical protein